MAVYAGIQQTASNPVQLLQGVPTQILLDDYTFGAIAATNLTVGRACFHVASGENAVQATGTGAGPFAGVVRRSNANSLAFPDSLLGYSLTVPVGQGASVITRGSVAVPIDVLVSGLSTPARGDFVYVLPSTGAFHAVAPGSTPVVNSVKTNFVIGNVVGTWTAGALVEITNTQNVGALA